MKEIEEILYREDTSKKFEKYIFIGTAYPEDMYQSPPNFKTSEEFKEFLADDDFAEILVNLAFSVMIYNQSEEEFEDLFGEEINNIFREKASKIEEIVDAWFWGIELPVFSGLDLRDKEIEESTYFDNGDYKEIIFTDGSEAKVINEKIGYGGGYYVPEVGYPQLFEDIEDLRKIIRGNT